MVGMKRAGNDLLVDFDGYAAEWNFKPREQIGNSRRRAQLAPLAVHKDANALIHAQKLLTQVAVSGLPWAKWPHGRGLGGTNGRGSFDPRESEGDCVAAMCVDDIAQRRG